MLHQHSMVRSVIDSLRAVPRGPGCVPLLYCPSDEPSQRELCIPETTPLDSKRTSMWIHVNIEYTSRLKNRGRLIKGDRRGCVISNDFCDPMNGINTKRENTSTNRYVVK